MSNKNIDFFKLPEFDDSNKKYSIAIIIPHQNNIEHLKKLLSYFNNNFNHKVDIFIIDQNNGDNFNRGFLLNVGYLIAKKHYSYDRYIFHDVDYYPDKNLYELYFKFIDYNIHFINFSNDKFLGGIFAIKSDDFEKINGFPNNFFGIGTEHEAFYNRCAINNIKIYRPDKHYLEQIKHKPIKRTRKYEDEVRNDYKNSNSNGLKQLLSFFINIKKYDVEKFINNYDIIDRNSVNNSEKIQDFIKHININNSIIAFKIDYLSNHTNSFDRLLKQDYVDFKINKIKQLYNGMKYYQHKKHPEIISIMEPLIFLNEIEEKIFKTYTNLKPFVNHEIKSKREIKIKNLVELNFKNHNNENKTKEDLFKTIKFLFESFNELLYFRIRNNKLECCYHLYNLENNIDWQKYIKAIDNKSIDEGLIDIMNSYDKPFYTLRKPHFLPSNNCLLGFDSYNYFDAIPKGYIKEFKEIIEQTIIYFKNVPDSDILINRKDFPFLNKDNTFAYEHLVIGEQAKINNMNNFYFFGTQSVKNNNIDIPIPSADEWKNIDTFNNIQDIKWKDKKTTAFFRGSSTGCGQKIENNPRMHLADLSFKWNKTKDKKDLLDCAISNLHRRTKLYKQFIGLNDMNKYEYLVGSFVGPLDQLKYKYIFNVQGNAQAYRFPNEFKKKSVILKVDSEYKMWFEPLLKEGIHYVSIKNDYSNLFEKLIYLKDNDKKAEKIAKLGFNFSNKYINKKRLMTYWFYYMINVNNKTK